MEHNISDKLTMWAREAPPENILFGDRCDLKEPKDGEATAKFSSVHIDDASVDYHIETDWQVTRAMLQWRDDASFVLNEKLEFKSIKLLDSIAEEIESRESETALQELSATLLIQCQTLFRDFLDVVMSS